MSSGKPWLALLFLLSALVSGWFLSNYLTPLLLGLHDAPREWNAWWQYFRALSLPQYAPYANRIKLGGALGFGLPLLLWGGLLILLFKSKSQSLHGDASFAELADLERAGLLKQTSQSILLGKYKGHYLWLGGSQHVIVVSPTRSGKTTSVAIPVLLSYLHSIVVMDIKGELYKATSGWRAAQGQVIYCWAPYNAEGQTHRFNPFTLLIGVDPGKRIGDIQTIAAILYPDEAGKDPFWTSQSRAAFTAFASCMFERWDDLTRAGFVLDPNDNECFPSFARILSFSSSGSGQSTRDLLQSVLTQSTFISSQTRTVFSNLVGLAEQTFSSVIATMQAPLQQFLSPILAAATRRQPRSGPAARWWFWTQHRSGGEGFPK